MVTTWLPHIQIMCKIPCAENSPISLHGIWSSAPFLLMHVSVMAQASHHTPPVTLLLNYQASKTWKKCAFICYFEWNRFQFVYAKWPGLLFVKARYLLSRHKWNFKKWHTDQSDSNQSPFYSRLVCWGDAVALLRICFGQTVKGFEICLFYFPPNT